MKYGYARVSSTTQDYAAQVGALKAAGAGSRAARTGIRPEFGKLKKAPLPGDVVVVAKLDRLARSSQGALRTSPQRVQENRLRPCTISSASCKRFGRPDGLEVGKSLSARETQPFKGDYDER